MDTSDWIRKLLRKDRSENPSADVSNEFDSTAPVSSNTMMPMAGSTRVGYDPGTAPGQIGYLDQAPVDHGHAQGQAAGGVAVAPDDAQDTSSDIAMADAALAGDTSDSSADTSGDFADAGDAEVFEDGDEVSLDDSEEVPADDDFSSDGESAPDGAAGTDDGGPPDAASANVADDPGSQAANPDLPDAADQTQPDDSTSGDDPGDDVPDDTEDSSDTADDGSEDEGAADTGTDAADPATPVPATGAAAMVPTTPKKHKKHKKHDASGAPVVISATAQPITSEAKPDDSSKKKHKKKHAGAEFGSAASGDIFRAGLGMFPHASNYHHSVSVSSRSTGAVIGGAIEPAEQKTGGWASASETPQDPAGAAMAVDSHWDTDPLSVKDNKHK